MIDLEQATADATGKAIATFPQMSIDRVATGITVQSTSTTQTLATVHLLSENNPYLDGTSTGNGDSGGAAGLRIPRYTTVIVRWLLATVGSNCTAQLIWEQE